VSTVDSNVLRTNQVLALRNLSRDSELNPVVIPSAPGSTQEVLAGVANTRLEDLEPLAITLVILDEVRRLGHVDHSRTRVLHGSANTELHGHLGAGCDLLYSGTTSGLESTLVTAEVVHVGSHVVSGVDPLGGIVLLGTSVLPDELVALGLLAVDDQDVEEIVSGG
jgi:hypothetical protein